MSKRIRIHFKIVGNAFLNIVAKFGLLATVVMAFILPNFVRFESEADIKTALTKLFLAMAGFAILESVVGYNKHRPGETLLKGLCYVGLMTVLALFFYFFSDVK